MQRTRQPFLGRLILSFIISNILFILIFLTTYSVSYLNYQKIAAQTNETSQHLAEMDHLFATSSISCETEILLRPSEILDEVGARISLLETRFGKNDPRVLEQKVIYTELEYKHFNFVKRVNEQCEKDKMTIMFFYTNIPPQDKESERMGFILSSFKQQAPEKIMIYSFDSNLDIPPISNLKAQYNITYTPQILVNEQDLFYLRNIRELENYL